jgi:hypothetical protein
MPAPNATDVLRAALSDLPPSAYSADRQTLRVLHRQVCDVVDELKAAGMMPEHVILAVKGVAFEAMMGPLAGTLIQKMVKWCLEQYFKDASTAG